MSNKSVFEQLSALNLSSKVEKRGQLSYLSWATAWAECKKLFPDMTRTVYESETGMNYFSDGATAWVKVGVTINSLEYIDYLPVMNHMNKSIPLASLTSFDVNKTIQRSTVKALALHGLALNIYAKEDFPEASDLVGASTKLPTKSPTKIGLSVGDANWEKVVNYVVDNIGLKSEDVFKNLSKKYELSDDVKSAINKLKK
jgi:hypothetical protein